MLKFNGEKNGNFELIKEGEYEVICSASWDKTKAGDKYINVKFKVREDVEQDYSGHIVFDPIYKSKKTGELQQGKINGILYAIPNAKLDFENYDELIQYINGKALRVQIGVEQANDYHQYDKNIVLNMSYEKTNHPITNETQPAKLEDGKEENLPF